MTALADMIRQYLDSMADQRAHPGIDTSQSRGGAGWQGESALNNLPWFGRGPLNMPYPREAGRGIQSWRRAPPGPSVRPLLPPSAIAAGPPPQPSQGSGGPYDPMLMADPRTQDMLAGRGVHTGMEPLDAPYAVPNNPLPGAWGAADRTPQRTEGDLPWDLRRILEALAR